MAKYNVKRYLQLLGLAVGYLEYYDKKYNKNLNSKQFKYKLDYHLFSYTQILYALKERLHGDFEKDSVKIKNYFGKGACRIVNRLAQEWKHKEGLEIRQHFKTKGSDPILKLTEVSKKLPLNHKLNPNDEPLIEIFKKCYEEVRFFCEQNSYV